MKKEAIKGAIFGLIVSLLIPMTVNAERVSLTSNGVINTVGSIVVYNEHFHGFRGNSDGSSLKIEINKNVLKDKYFSVTGYLYVTRPSGQDGTVYNNLQITTLSQACKVDFANYAITGSLNEPDGNAISQLQIRDRANLYYFECNHISYNVDHTLRFELLGYYPANIGGIYMYDWLNFSYDEDSSSNAQSIIDNQNKNQLQTNERLDGLNKRQEQTNQELGELNDNLTSNDVDTNAANSFFGDFKDNDHGGISGVITAPLRFINKITGTCQPILLDVLGADVELPCGDTLFWNKPEVAEFRTIWNLLFGGVILYAMMCKLFKVIEGLKNPDDSRIEVMKL